jgi:hypothetical protein
VRLKNYTRLGGEMLTGGSKMIKKWVSNVNKLLLPGLIEDENQ